MKTMIKKKDLFDYLMSALGGIIYAVAFQIFAASMGLFMGNVTGIAQILYDISKDLIPLKFNYTGILLLLINLPLFFISFKEINRKFFLKTLINTLVISVFMQLVPAVKLEGINDTLTLSIIGGALCGYGSGLCLRYGGSAGGIDILGVYVSMKYSGFSVGKVSMLIGAVVYTYALFTYTPAILIYSVIFTVVSLQVLDKMHYQNVKSTVHIISKSPHIKRILVEEIGRGGTYWKAKGAYTDSETYVYLTVMSKYEIIRLKRILRKVDKHVFIIENGTVDLSGNYESHLF